MSNWRDSIVEAFTPGMAPMCPSTSFGSTALIASGVLPQVNPRKPFISAASADTAQARVRQTRSVFSVSMMVSLLFPVGLSGRRVHAGVAHVHVILLFLRRRS